MVTLSEKNAILLSFVYRYKNSYLYATLAAMSPLNICFMPYVLLLYFYEYIVNEISELNDTLNVQHWTKFICHPSENQILFFFSLNLLCIIFKKTSMRMSIQIQPPFQLLSKRDLWLSNFFISGMRNLLRTCSKHYLKLETWLSEAIALVG